MKRCRVSRLSLLGVTRAEQILASRTLWGASDITAPLCVNLVRGDIKPDGRLSQDCGILDTCGDRSSEVDVRPQRSSRSRSKYRGGQGGHVWEGRRRAEALVARVALRRRRWQIRLDPELGLLGVHCH